MEHVGKLAGTLEPLNRANDDSEWLWKIYFAFMVISIPANVSLSIASILYCWLIGGNFEVNQFYHPFQVM